MYPGIIIGRVVATEKTSSLSGKKLLLLQPTDWKRNPSGEPLVAVDTVGSGAGEFVFFVKAREAAVACGGTGLHDTPPIDAAVLGIIDGVDIRE